MASAGEFIGKTIGGGKVAQIDYDWAFDPPTYYTIVGESTFILGYEDRVTSNRYSLNGAWGSYNEEVGVPNLIDLSSKAYAAGSYTRIQAVTGWMWNAIDDGLELGSSQCSGSTVAEKLATWNAILDIIDETVSWIYGNVRDGGLGFLKYDTNAYYMISTYGLYTNDLGHEKIAAAATNWTAKTSDFQDGCFAVYVRNRSIVSNVISWVHGTQYNTCYVLSEHVNDGYGTIVWYGSQESFSATLDASSTKEENGSVKNTLFSLNSVSSPYADGMDCYWPDRTITDAGYSLTQGSPLNIALEEEAAGGDSGDNNGDGDFDNSSDDIPLTTDDQFTIDAQSSGFLTVFKPSKSTIQSFANWLYGTVPTTFSSWLENISKLQSNPMDGIISLNIAHYDAPAGASQSITFFGKDSGATAPVVSQLTRTMDCGSVEISEYSGNFLDYGNRSNIKIFVPYCGTFSLATNEVMGATLHLQYVIDILTGSCVAELEVKRQRSKVYADPNLNAQIYRFTGNIFQQIPVTAVDYSNIMRGQLSLAAGAATALAGAASSNPMGVLGGLSGIANAAMSMSPTVERVGSCGSDFGYMSYQKPFIIQEYPWYNWPNKYDNYYGRPLYDYGLLSSYHGYTEIDTDTLWTDKFDDITAEEEQMIKDICNKGGIYIDHTAAYYNYDPDA